MAILILDKEDFIAKKMMLETEKDIIFWKKEVNLPRKHY